MTFLPRLKISLKILHKEKVTYLVIDGLLAFVGTDWESICGAVKVSKLSTVGTPSKLTCFYTFFINLIAYS